MIKKDVKINNRMLSFLVHRKIMVKITAEKNGIACSHELCIFSALPASVILLRTTKRVFSKF